MTRLVLMACIASAGCLASGGGWAAPTLTASMDVTANVINTCTVGDDTIAFGDISPKQAATMTAIVRVQCTALTVLGDVFVSMGNNPDAGTPPTRRLSSVVPDYIPYTLKMGNVESVDETTNVRNGFQWYNYGTPSSFKYEGVLTATIASTDTARAEGEYSDTVIVTVSYDLGDPDN